MLLLLAAVKLSILLCENEICVLQLSQFDYSSVKNIAEERVSNLCSAYVALHCIRVQYKILFNAATVLIHFYRIFCLTPHTHVHTHTRTQLTHVAQCRQYTLYM